MKLKRRKTRSEASSASASASLHVFQFEFSFSTSDHAVLSAPAVCVREGEIAKQLKKSRKFAFLWFEAAPASAHGLLIYWFWLLRQKLECQLKLLFQFHKHWRPLGVLRGGNGLFLVNTAQISDWHGGGILCDIFHLDEPDEPWRTK